MSNYHKFSVFLKFEKNVTTNERISNGATALTMYLHPNVYNVIQLYVLYGNE